MEAGTRKYTNSSMPSPTLNSFFDPTSPHYNGAVYLPTPTSAQSTFTDGVSPTVIGAGDLISNVQQKAGVLYNGKTTFDNTVAGYILGPDDSDNLLKFYIGDATTYLNWTGTA